MSEPSVLLDRATAAKEVAILTALVLMRVEGDAEAALTMLDEFRGIAEPETVDELDAVAIATQAVIEARAMRGGGDV
jgi:hypothetical protein